MWLLLHHHQYIAMHTIINKWFMTGRQRGSGNRERVGATSGGFSRH
ncbi:hypothetical protein [Inoviridae sp.]|nr:hypothetical protein [Inoviridae sp.]